MRLTVSSRQRVMMSASPDGVLREVQSHHTGAAARLAQLEGENERLRERIGKLKGKVERLAAEKAELIAPYHRGGEGGPEPAALVRENAKLRRKLASSEDQLDEFDRVRASDLKRQTVAQERESLERLTGDVAKQFQQLFVDCRSAGLPHKNMYWLGVRVAMNPLDLWIFQELLTDVRPDLIVETGTAFGGTSLFLASVCEKLDRGRVVTIDIEGREGRPVDQRIEYIAGSSTDSAIISEIARRAESAEMTMVILDSRHSASHVSHELDAYADLVSPGSYLIVTNTQLNGNPIRPDYGPGPAEAVDAFLIRDTRFERDASREKFLMTYNPGGYLRRRDG